MHIAATDRPDEAGSHEGNTAVADARLMTQAQLREFGVSRLVYLRVGMKNGQIAFAIHGADGVAVAVTEDIDLAVELVTEQGMVFVPVH